MISTILLSFVDSEVPLDVLVYDIIISDSYQKIIQLLKQYLSSYFHIKDLGTFIYFGYRSRVTFDGMYKIYQIIYRVTFEGMYKIYQII